MYNSIATLMAAGAAVDAVNSTGSTALHGAAQRGDLNCVKLLVETGHVDYNLPRKNGQMPLHLAAAHGHVDMVEYLLDKGARLSDTAETFGTPLEVAMRLGHLDVVKFLVDKGATTTMDMSQPASWGNKAEMLEFAQGRPLSFKTTFSAYALQQAIISLNRNLVKLLVEKTADVNEECQPYKTVLQAAAMMGLTGVVEKLLLKGADPNITGGRYGSALGAAITARDSRSVKLLLEHGADPTVEYKGEGAIFLAIRLHALEIVTALLDHMEDTDRVAKGNNGCSLLACAIGWGHEAVADHLLSLHHVPIDDRDFGGRTPLMVAVMRDNARMVKTLLERGADPNATDTEHKTPLIRAIASPKINREITTALLEHPDLDPSLQDCRGRTYAYWAARLRLERNAIESNVGESAKDRLNYYLPSSLVLHAAFASGKESVVMDAIYNMQSEDLVELDGDGWTALYTATRYKMAVMDALLEPRPPSPRLQKPWKWHEEDKSPCLQVSGDGKVVTIKTGSPGRVYYTYLPRAVIRADHAMPGNEMYYFEIEIMEDAEDKIISVGFCEEHAPLDRMLGWDEGSWGYHGNDGDLLNPCGATKYGPRYAKGNVVGCGVDFDREVAFFTLDGAYLGVAFRGIKGKLYPAVYFNSESEGCCVLANFGQKPFKFDMSKWNAEEALAQPPATKRAAHASVARIRRRAR